MTAPAGLLPFYRDERSTEAQIFLQRQRHAALNNPMTFSQSQGTGEAPSLSSEERWVQSELPFYDAQYTTRDSVSVVVTTFNVGCKKPGNDFEHLVAKAQSQSTDLIVVGFQEVDMSATAMWKEETEAAVPWVTGLIAELNADVLPTAGFAGQARTAGGAYTLVCSRQLVGMLLCCFIRKPVLAFVDDIQIATVSTGALGSVGNKGCVGVSFKLYLTHICFLTAHLAAGQTQVSKRNEDIHTILTTMDFNAAKRQAVFGGYGGVVETSDLSIPIKGPKDHDLVIIAGDLNYRVNTSYEAAVQLAGADDYDALLQDDQLVAELKNTHTVWRGFCERRPSFRPTYRFDVGTSTYDTSEKRRIPSYTDRILIWAKSKDVLDAVDWGQQQALTQVLSSDHKPVRMIGKLPVRSVMLPKRDTVLNQLRDTIRQYGLERVSRAKTVISEQSLDFGTQEFHHCGERRVLQIRNVGECVATVRAFRQQVERSEGTWLRVTPSAFDILPGESAEVTVESVLDTAALHWTPLWLPYRGQSATSLKSQITFHVFRGTAHTVVCSTVVTPSVFGNTLENICALEDKCCIEGYASHSPPVQGPPLPRLPKELWFLGDAVVRRGLKDPNLLAETCSLETCSALMSFLDRNSNLSPIPDDYSMDVIGSCILYFLSALQEPVVPYAMYQQALSAIRTGGRTPVFFVQQQLPSLHANVFTYVVSLLNCLLRPSNSASNELTAAYVAQIFSQVMLRRPAALTATQQQGGISPHQIRQQLQQDHDDSVKFLLFFLTPPPVFLQ